MKKVFPQVIKFFDIRKNKNIFHSKAFFFLAERMEIWELRECSIHIFYETLVVVLVLTAWKLLKTFLAFCFAREDFFSANTWGHSISWTNPWKKNFFLNCMKCEFSLLNTKLSHIVLKIFNKQEKVFMKIQREYPHRKWFECEIVSRDLRWIKFWRLNEF